MSSTTGMNTYQIVLVCPFCDATVTLGTVQADTRYDAKLVAEVRWPDARYEEMIARKVESMPMRAPSSVLPVEQFS